MAGITVQYLADQLGLSKFAVSRALAGKPGVSEATRQRVIETAQQFGYVPKPKFKKRANAIEIIFHDPDVAHRELWVAIQAGAQEEAVRLGLGTAVRWTGDAEIFARLRTNTAGFILIGPHEPAMLEAARQAGPPCVRIGPPLPSLEPMDVVGGTSRESAVRVAEFLLGLGHRRFVYAQGRPGYPGRIERLQTFAETIAADPGTELREMVFRDDNAPGDFRTALLAMAQAGFEPTAFFCGNDGVAVTVVSELMRMGLRVPEDVSVVGYDNAELARSPLVVMASVDHNSGLLGEISAGLVPDRLAGHNHPPQLVPEPTLIVRRTTAAAPGVKQGSLPPQEAQRSVLAPASNRERLIQDQAQVCRIMGKAAQEQPIHLGQPGQQAGAGAAAVNHRYVRTQLGAQQAGNSVDVVFRRRPGCSDGPYRLIRQHEARRHRRAVTDGGADLIETEGSCLLRGPRRRLTDAQQRRYASPDRFPDFLPDDGVILTKVAAPLGVAQFHQADAELGQHSGADLPGEGTLGRRAVLCAEDCRQAVEDTVGAFQHGKGRIDENPHRSGVREGRAGAHLLGYLGQPFQAGRVAQVHLGADSYIQRLFQRPATHNRHAFSIPLIRRLKTCPCY